MDFIKLAAQCGARIGRQLDLPVAGDPASFERQVFLVVEVRLEQAAIVVRSARHDRLHGAEVVPEILPKRE
jgi:hypothetical protein